MSGSSPIVDTSVATVGRDSRAKPSEQLSFMVTDRRLPASASTSPSATSAALTSVLVSMSAMPVPVLRKYSLGRPGRPILACAVARSASIVSPDGGTTTVHAGLLQLLAPRYETATGAPSSTTSG